jgi:hypothetical protein
VRIDTASNESKPEISSITYARSSFEDTRRKAAKFGAYGTTVKAFKPPN